LNEWFFGQFGVWSNNFFSAFFFSFFWIFKPCGIISFNYWIYFLRYILFSRFIDLFFFFLTHKEKMNKQRNKTFKKQKARHFFFFFKNSKFKKGTKCVSIHFEFSWHDKEWIKNGSLLFILERIHQENSNQIFFIMSQMVLFFFLLFFRSKHFDITKTKNNRNLWRIFKYY